MTKNYTIGITSKHWHEIAPELAQSHVFFENKITEIINIPHYGSGLSSILCFFVCVPFDDPNKERERFYTKDKELYIVRQLDYATFSQLNVEDALKMQAQVFLAALAKVKSRKKTIPNFDFGSFYTDVENLFREKNWL